MRPELVLFDCDGVLVDSERITVAVEARLLTSLGWPITPDEAEAGAEVFGHMSEVPALLGV